MFFVMLYHPNADIPGIIMTCGIHNDTAFFETEEDARSAAENNTLGENFGYEISELKTDLLHK